MAGIGAFLILGLHRASPSGKRPFWLREWFLWTAWTAGFLFFGSQNRGGLLSVLIAMTMVLVLWRNWRWAMLAIVVLCGFTLLVVLDLEVDVGLARKVSPQQLLTNLNSIVGGGGIGDQNTRLWRLQWWQTILDYTVWGDYFWGGKGFGVNLADADGFQTDRNHALRSAHNGHLTILARSGIPGLSLWILLQGSLFLGLLRAFFRARRAGNHRWAAFVVWILAYWVAFTVNSAFDVYLEGPQGGVWFWAVFGVGLAVLLARPEAPRREMPESVTRGLAMADAI
jgi:O-antigen ligase